MKGSAFALSYLVRPIVGSTSKVHIESLLTHILELAFEEQVYRMRDGSHPQQYQWFTWRFQYLFGVLYTKKFYGMLEAFFEFDFGLIA